MPHDGVKVLSLYITGIDFAVVEEIAAIIPVIRTVLFDLKLSVTTNGNPGEVGDGLLTIRAFSFIPLKILEFSTYWIGIEIPSALQSISSLLPLVNNITNFD